MRVEEEHQLRFEAVASHTTDHGVCICGWLCWSPNGKREVRELHELHRDFERRKAAEQLQHLKTLEVNKHIAQWNTLGDVLACSHCDWVFQSSNTAKAIVAFNQHREDVRNAI